MIANHATACAQALGSLKFGRRMGYLQQVGAHHHARSTNCLPELTVCRACLVGADTRGQAPEAKGGVEVTEASPAAGGGALGLRSEHFAGVQRALGSPRSDIALHGQASLSGRTWP